MTPQPLPPHLHHLTCAKCRLPLRFVWITVGEVVLCLDCGTDSEVVKWALSQERKAA